MKSKIEIRKSKIKGAGRGVFALKNIKKDEVVEMCPIMIINEKDYLHLKKTILGGYVFGYTGRAAMLALGYGSLYNHHNSPNAMYELVEHENGKEHYSELYITAIKPIPKDGEIYINYGGHYDKMYAEKPKK